MQQTTIHGPADHPLASADRIVRLESDPAEWIHDDSDVDRCSHCETLIQLGDGDFIAVTLAEGDWLKHTKTVERICDAECYRDWAQMARDAGW